jgi:heme-degrading monooxygenase HmoA
VSWSRVAYALTKSLLSRLLACASHALLAVSLVDAFKEAHGGTSIGAFLTTMIGSAFVLRGPPRPAFYDALALTAVKPKETPKTVDGWRDVSADGINTLPVECFVSMDKYFVLADKQADFEKFWIEREPTLAQVEGFVAFTMLRRDGQAKGHGVVEMTETEPNYQGVVIFKDRASHGNWRADSEAQAPEQKLEATKMWSKSPEKVFYEGTLVISSEEGP